MSRTRVWTMPTGVGGAPRAGLHTESRVHDPVIGLPLRVGRDGRLVRSEPAEGLLGLIRAMAATSAGSWPHAPWFGLQEVLAGANMAFQNQQQIADAINRALGELGVTQVRAASVTTESAREAGEQAFHIVLVGGDGQATHLKLAV